MPRQIETNAPQQVFLSAKFTPAALPEIYAPRHELIAAFHKAAEGRFVYVGAPGGCGKTVSALLWLTACGRQPVWIGLDEYDNAPAVFFKQLATGLYSTQADNKRMEAILTDDAFSASPVEHTIAMLSEMRPSGGLRALILDDAHLITNDEIIKALPSVLKRLPSSFVTLVLSRNEAFDTLDGLVKEENVVTRERLRFSGEEIRQYFNSLGRFLSSEEAQFAYISTDGWAMGVNAVAKSEQIEGGSSGRLFSHYFEANIWCAWDDGLRDFCLKTSVVDEFGSGLAKRLSGREDAREVLESLSRSNNFISHQGEDRYRYHHLFRDFLREKAEGGGADVGALCKIAAEYYRDGKDYSMALRFWLDSGDYKGADKFLLLFMFANNRGVIAEYVDFLRLYFIRDFPDKAFEEFPALHVCCAWYYYMTSQFAEYEKHADAGYKHIARIALYDPKFVEFAALMYSVDHRSGMLEKLKKFGAFGKLVNRFTSDGIIRNIASCTHNLPYAHKSSFDYSDVFADPKGVEKVRGSFFVNLLGDQSEVVIRLGQAGFYYEQNNLELALGETRWLGDTLTEQNSIELRVSAKLLHHSVLLRMGRVERAEEAAAALQGLTEFVSASAQFFLANLEAYKTKLALLDGDKAAARAWLDNYFVVEATHIELFMVFQHFTTARAHIVLGDYERARKYVALLREFGENLNRVCDFGEASVLWSALEWQMGNKKEATATLTRALEKLQPYGFARSVIDEGAAILPVLKRVLAGVGRADYAGPLKREFVGNLMLAAHSFAKQHKGIACGSCGNANPQKPVKLSRQQKLVLTLLSQGYSNTMILRETGLKITTIKTHTALAYGKLNVNNALDAVLRARELGLIE
jgi:LuxR family maltose regulon positive regulatory protein